MTDPAIDTNPIETTDQISDSLINTASDYDSGNVQILRDADHIRRRPGVYIGDINTTGLHHLVYELVYNAVDEALAGFCKHIHVKIDVDGSCSVRDDGRGIPVDMHPQANKPTLEVVMTTVGAGGKFDHGAYKTSAGLHGMGAKAVTALSVWTEAEVRRNGRVYTQQYERGRAVSEVRDIGPGQGTGTKVTFMPDTEIFGNKLAFDFDTLESRLRELAFLNKGLHFHLSDARIDKTEEYHYEGGVAEYVAWMNRNEDTIHPPIPVDRDMDHIKVQVAVQYTSGEEERVRCYANTAYNPVGGTHLTGFRVALTRSLGAYGEKEGFFTKIKPEGQDYRTGVTAIVSIQHPEPQFESQNKIRLLNADVEPAVAAAVAEALSKYLEENPKHAKAIMGAVIRSAEAREAASKARKAVRDRKSLLGGGSLPGKLFDCTTRKRDESELFLVEGDSAGGSAESGRNRMIQAILPLRGKPLNVEKARMENLLANNEITSLISAIGVDIGNELPYEKLKETLRYNRIIIMTDADVDGQHIRTLLLTFFYRQMRILVEMGHIYVARPPLYKVVQRKQTRFVSTGDEMVKELLDRGLHDSALLVYPKQAANAGPAVGLSEPAKIDGARLRELIGQLGKLEDAIGTLERRGIPLPNLVARLDTANSAGPLPSHRVIGAGIENWFFNRADVEDHRLKLSEKLASQGKLLVVVDEAVGQQAEGESFHAQELHEVREINRGIAALAAFDLYAHDLVPQIRVAGREPAIRLALGKHEDSSRLSDLRKLAGDIRKMGEKGMTITRFKGLGEMDPEELWETTLDPEKRTLMQIKLDDAVQADELFRTLMGEKVEPRRDFINKHALQVREIDWHGT